MERNVFERKQEYYVKQKLPATRSMPSHKTDSPNVYHDTLMHMFECSQKSSDNLPAPTPHPALTTEPYCFHSAAGQRSRL